MRKLGAFATAAMIAAVSLTGACFVVIIGAAAQEVVSPTPIEASPRIAPLT